MDKKVERGIIMTETILLLPGVNGTELIRMMARFQKNSFGLRIMNATEFANSVKDQSWDIADQIIKANPNATITREELANALINNFNHRIRKEYRVVQGFNIPQTTQRIAQPSGPATRQYDYSKYE